LARRILVSGAVGVALLGAAAPALAQVGEGRRAREGDRRGEDDLVPNMRRLIMGGAGGMEGQTLSRRIVEDALAPLMLGDEQRDVAMTLMEGYEGRVEQLREDVRAMREETMRAARDAGDGSGFEKMREAMLKARDERKKLDTQLMADLQAVLTPEQAKGWGDVERTIRRGQSLRRGIAAGERTDLHAIVREMELPAESTRALAPVMEQYSLDLDRELLARDTLADAGPDFFSLMRGGDADAIEKSLTARRDAAIKVREVNRRFTSQVQGLLPEERKAEFARRVKEASYPSIYRATRGARAMEAALGMEDLTEEQRSSIQVAKDAYEASVAATNDKLAKAWDEAEASFDPARFAREGPRGMRQREGSEEAQALRQARRDAEQRAISQLREVLTPEQAERLPRRDEGDQDR
jgi:Spy/CpxP family protein refolding chaperone